MKKIYNIVVTENYKGKNNEDKTAYTTVGVAFHNQDTNSYSCRIKPGLAITGDFVLFERTAKEQGSSD